MKEDPATHPSEPGKKREKKGSRKETSLTTNSALIESEERFRKIFENSPIGMALVAPDFRFFSVNPAWIAMTGYSEEELLKMSFKDITHPEHFAGDLEHIRELIAGTIPVYSVEKRYIRKDGSILWGLLGVTAIRDTRGAFRHLAAQIEDITERKRAEEALRTSEEKYRTLFEEFSDGLFITSPGGKILDMNKKGISMFGYDTKEEMLRLDLEKDVYAKPPDRNRILSMVNAHGSAEYEVIVRKKNGEKMVTHSALTAVKDEAGVITSYQGIIRDITDKKQAEDAFRKSEEKYRSLYRNSALGIFHSSFEGRFIDVNPALAKMLGYSSPEKVVGSVTSIAGQVYFEPPQYSAVSAAVLDAGGILRTENRYRRRDGSLWYGMLHLRIVPDEEGRPSHYEGFVEDITERIAAEDALRKSEEKFRNLFDWANDAVMLHTLTTKESPGRFIDVNRVACRMLGYSRDELLGIGPPDIVPAELHTRLSEIIRQAANHDSVLFEIQFRRKDGTTFPVESSGHLITYEGKRIWISHIRDITGRRQVEEMRELLIRELALKNAELDRFTSTVSHDLKSPLIAIRAFLSLLEGDIKSGKTGQVQADIARIDESAEKLESLINTLLALSRSGKSVDAPVQIPFSDLAHEAAGLLEPSWRKRGITVIIPDTLPVISGDRPRLLQVMTNLIDNAVRFMGDPQGPCIEIGMRDDAGTPVFFVRDSGMGIKKENLPRVFGLFERFNPDIPGTGIGLATVKRIIEAHGGRIWVESEGEGKGTTFKFTLPVA